MTWALELRTNRQSWVSNSKVIRNFMTTPYSELKDQDTRQKAHQMSQLKGNVMVMSFKTTKKIYRNKICINKVYLLVIYLEDNV